MSITDKFEDFIDHISDLFTKKWYQYLPFLKGALKVLEKDAQGILQAAAIAAVTAAQSTAGSGGDKMSAAPAMFKDTITSQGKDFIESEARFLLETALQNLKA